MFITCTHNNCQNALLKQQCSVHKIQPHIKYFIHTKKQIKVNNQPRIKSFNKRRRNGRNDYRQGCQALIINTSKYFIKNMERKLRCLKIGFHRLEQYKIKILLDGINNRLLLSCFSCVRLCATPQMAAHQVPPSLGFSWQEHWSGLPFPFPMHESEK